MSPDPKKPVSPSSGEAAKAHEDRMTDLFRSENNNVRKLLRRKASAEVTEELLAEAFAKVWATDTSSISCLRAYLIQTARNLLADHYRKKEEDGRKLGWLEHEMTSQSTPSLEKSLLAQELKDLFDKAIDGLPARCRATFRMHLEDLPNRQIVAYFASKGIRIRAWTVRRDINCGYETCRQALEASEETKQERSK
jgi:RNA polymerase sigma factor (sigma-70 family)